MLPEILLHMITVQLNERTRIPCEEEFTATNGRRVSQIWHIPLLIAIVQFVGRIVRIFWAQLQPQIGYL